MLGLEGLDYFSTIEAEVVCMRVCMCVCVHPLLIRDEFIID